MEISSELALSCHNKLIYTVSLGVRAVFAHIEANALVLTTYFWREPTEYERELFQGAAWEVLEDVGGVTDAVVRIEVTKAPFSKLHKPERWLFVRAEEL